MAEQDFEADEGDSDRAEYSNAPLSHACIFRIDEQKFALDVRFVGEVIQAESFTPVPMSPPGVIGMVNLRGTALTVIDLSRVIRLGGSISPEKRSGGAYVLVLRLEKGMTIGVVIDRMDAVTSWDESDLRKSDAIGEHPAIRGVLDISRRGLVASMLDGVEISHRLESMQSGRRGS